LSGRGGKDETLLIEALDIKKKEEEWKAGGVTECSKTPSNGHLLTSIYN